MAYTGLNFVAGEVLTSTKMNALAMNDEYVKSESERIDKEHKTTANEVEIIKADINEAANILDSILGENTGTDEGSGGGSGENTELPVTPTDTPEGENNANNTEEGVNG